MASLEPWSGLPEDLMEWSRFVSYSPYDRLRKCCGSLKRFSFICMACTVLLLLLIVLLITLNMLRLSNVQCTARINNNSHEFVRVGYDQLAKDEPIELDNVRIDAFIFQMQVSYNESQKFWPNDLLVFDEKIISDGRLLQLIGERMSKAYWFFSERNARALVWTSCYFELPADVKSTAQSSEVLLKFNGKRVTVKASLLDVWCQPWDALYEHAKITAASLTRASGGDVVKVPVVIELYYDVALPYNGGGSKGACLTVSGDGEAGGHVGLYRSTRPINRPSVQTTSFDSGRLATESGSLSSSTVESIDEPATLSSTRVESTADSTTTRVDSPSIATFESTTGSATLNTKTDSLSTSSIVMETTSDSATREADTSIASSTVESTTQSTSVNTTNIYINPLSSSSIDIESIADSTIRKTDPPSTSSSTVESTTQSTTVPTKTNPSITSSTDQTTSTPSTVGTTTARPFDVKAFFENVNEYVLSTLSFPKVFDVVLFDKTASFDEAQEICEYLERRDNVSSSLIELITSERTHLAALKDAIANETQHPFNGNASDTGEHLIWTGAYLDPGANDSMGLRLPNNEKRYHLATVNSVLCEDSKDYNAIFEEQVARYLSASPSEPSSRSFNVHLFMMYNEMRELCLTLRAEMPTSGVTAACQRNLVIQPFTRREASVVQRSYFPVIIFGQLSYSHVEPLCLNVKGIGNYSGVPLSHNVAGNKWLLEQAANVSRYYRQAFLWTGGYFDLRSENPFRLLWGAQGFKSNPRKLSTWCDDNNYDAQERKINETIKQTRHHSGAVILPVVWQIDDYRQPSCLTVHLPEALWPGRSHLSVVCNEENISIRSTSGEDYFSAPALKGYDFDLFQSSVKPKNLNTAYIYLNQTGVAGGFLFINEKFTFKAVAEVFCKSSDLKGAIIDLSNVADVAKFKEDLLDEMRLRGVSLDFKEVQYWTGGYFDLNATDSTQLLWYDKSDVVTMSEFNNKLPMCDNVNATSVLLANKSEYHKHYTGLKYYPDFDPYVRVAIRLLDEATCAVLVWKEFDWPESVNLYGICVAM